MKISTFADLCLRILLTLAVEAPLTGKALAERVGLPYNHVAKAVLRLKDLGLLDVQRGRTGGASLTEAGRRASVGWLLRELDTREDVADCVRESGHVCPLIGGCRLRGALNEAREAFYRSLDGVLIADLAPDRSSVTSSGERVTGLSISLRPPSD